MRMPQVADCCGPGHVPMQVALGSPKELQEE